MKKQTTFIPAHRATAFLLLALIASSLLLSCAQTKAPTEGKAIIFDSDIGPDYDDVGAITILHVLEEQGKTKILATIACNKYEGIAGILDVFNTYYGEPDLPIGVPKGEAVNKRDSQHWTDSLLAHFPHSVQSNAEVPGAVELYRKLLSEQPDTSVTIVSVGFFTNLSNLLNSKADKFSELDGRALVQKKVKVLVSMAGDFPSGREFNVFNDAPASQNVCDNWPTPIIFSGFEIGKKIKTGLPIVQNEAISNNPAKEAFRIALPQRPVDSAGRMSWDEVTVLAAVKGYEPYFTLQEGRISVAADGSNSWDDQGKGQFYLVEKVPPAQLEDEINQLMMTLPKEQ